MKYHGFIWAGIFVQDLAKSILFYRDVLGLPLLRNDEDFAHFDAGDGALLELFSGGRAHHAPKKADQQSIRFGLRVDDLDEAIAELQERGVGFPEGVGEFEGGRWAHFTDPEGNGLEIKEVPAN